MPKLAQSGWGCVIPHHKWIRPGEHVAGHSGHPWPKLEERVVRLRKEFTDQVFDGGTQPIRYHLSEPASDEPWP